MKEMEASKDDSGGGEGGGGRGTTVNPKSESSSSSSTKGKSCKGTLYYSSIIKAKGRNPRCIGLSRTLNHVPSYIVSETEVEASKQGRSLADFRYACLGYAVFLDHNQTSTDAPNPSLPVCVGLELLVDKTASDHSPAHAHNGEDDRGVAQAQPQKPPTQHVGEEFLDRFTRNANLVASGVARNLRKVGNHIKESVSDILYPYRRRPK